MLTAIPEEEEIKDAIFNMSSNSVGGLDGFNGSFYQNCWNIIKEDVVESVQDFFNGKKLSKYFSHTCLALIPKIESPQTFSVMRPISLSNFSSKIWLKTQHSSAQTYIWQSKWLCERQAYY